MFLYNNIYIFKGFSRSLVVDTERSEHFFVPNSFFYLCQNGINDDIPNEVFEEYSDFLSKHELGFISNEINFVSNIEILNPIEQNNFENEKPQTVEITLEYLNFILDKNNLIFMSRIDELEIKNLNIILNKKDNFLLKEVLVKLEISPFQQIAIINKSNEEFDEEVELIEFRKLNRRFLLFVVLDFDIKRNLQKKIDFDISIYRINPLINSPLFILKSQFIKESFYYNPYLYGKIILECNNKLKNGNSFYDLKKDVKSFYEENWNFSKNKILVCSDCEYRHVCYDRIKYATLGNQCIRVIECDYNPYISKWKAEEGYHSLAESGITISEEGVNINYEVLNALNEKLWSTP